MHSFTYLVRFKFLPAHQNYRTRTLFDRLFNDLSTDCEVVALFDPATHRHELMLHDSPVGTETDAVTSISETISIMA